LFLVSFKGCIVQGVQFTKEPVLRICKPLTAALLHSDRWCRPLCTAQSN